MSDPLVIIDFPSHADGTVVRQVFRDPLEIIEASAIADVIPALTRVGEAAAGGKWCAGFVTYEAAPAFEPAMHVRSGGGMPLLWFGVYDACEHEDDNAGPGPRAQAPVRAWRPDETDADHRAAITSIQDAIAAGETYQVNYTTRLRTEFSGDARAWYDELRLAQGNGWHAFVRTPQHEILSASPELFFRRRGNRIETRPMKGTGRRGRWLEEDRARAAALLASEKDRAENLMIVDLLRNDVGRIAVNGSVRVPSLFDVERYETVWQLTSRIEGELRGDIGLVDVFRALFPCGSVTGAPKINTMKWITRLEKSPREVYCGAIGVVAPGGECAFNVPIRTVTVERETGRAVYGVGSGITTDSSVAGELAEFRAKADVLLPRPAFELLETMRIESGSILRRPRHVARVMASAEYFGFALSRSMLEDALDREAAAIVVDARVRMTVAADGVISFDPAEPAPPRFATRDACRSAGAVQQVVVADLPVDGSDPFLCNKTTHRIRYNEARAAAPAAFDVLLFNVAGELTEFTNGNLVVEQDGRLLTPLRDAGLLAGTFRQELLDAGAIVEAVLPRSLVGSFERVWLVNSVREWVEVSAGDSA